MGDSNSSSSTLSPLFKGTLIFTPGKPESASGAFTSTSCNKEGFIANVCLTLLALDLAATVAVHIASVASAE